MVRRSSIAFPVALAALGLLAASATAQDFGGGGGGPGGPPMGGSPAGVDPAGGAAVPGTPAEGAEAAPAVEKIDTHVEVRGNRFRIKLGRGSVIEGIIPGGIVKWEKLDKYGENYVPAKETDKGVGLRLYYVLNLDGELFIKRADIAKKEDSEALEIRDLGELTEEQKAAIRDRVLLQRRHAIADREKKLREDMARLKMAETDVAAGAGEGAKDAKKDAEAAAVKKGEALLEKFPPPDWGEERKKKILEREIINGIFRSETEAEFIDNLPAWTAALERRQRLEEEKKAAEKGTGEGKTSEGGK